MIWGGACSSRYAFMRTPAHNSQFETTRPLSADATNSSQPQPVVGQIEMRLSISTCRLAGSPSCPFGLVTNCREGHGTPATLPRCQAIASISGGTRGKRRGALQADRCVRCC
jgi:hypothetical protein